ncbi:MAG: EAL domain-containing protein, partial [Planctomycetota bacterium]
AAIDSVREWSEAGQLPFPISVNVATEDLFTEDFVASLGARIEAAGIDPALLRLEVPEAGVLADLDRATERLEELRALGVSLALDDFGGEDTPGVADLKRLPIDVLKVHRSFVLGMEAEPSLDALVRGVITLAGALGIQTVAAGVETEAQLEHLAEYGCSAVQGFLLSPPLSRDAFEAKLAEL